MIIESVFCSMNNSKKAQTGAIAKYSEEITDQIELPSWAKKYVPVLTMGVVA
jgi:hypothetical protein